MPKWLKSLFWIFTDKVAVVPDGFVLVPENPSEAHIESMCVRFDHSHNMKHSWPLQESEEHFQARRRFNRSTVLQLYEEATGQGFYKLTASEQPVGPDWMETKDLVELIRYQQRTTAAPGCDWVSAKNSHVESGSVCLTCNAIDSREPEQITGCAKELVEVVT